MLGGVNNPLFFGAFAGFAILAIIIVPLLRWAFSTKKTGLGVPKRIGQPHDYGSLTPVGKPVSFIEGEVMRKKLESNGIRANVSQTTDGVRVFVFPEDADKAKSILASG